MEDYQLRSNCSCSSMKVVHLCMQEFGGAGKAAYRLHKGLQSIGVDSTMIVFDKKKDDPSIKVLPEGFLADNLSCQDVPAFESMVWRRARIRWESLSKVYPDRPAGLELFSDAESEVRLGFIKEIRDADIINLHWVAGMLNYPHLPQAFRNKQIVWTLHDMNPFTGGCHYAGDCMKYTQSCEACPQLGSEDPQDLSRNVWDQKSNAFKDIDINVVTPSRWLGECASKSKLFSRFNVDVIANGFPIQIFKPYPKAEVLKALNVSPSARVILFGAASVTNERKGFRFLLSAIEKLSLKDDKENIIFTFGTLPQGANINAKYQICSLGSIADEKKLAMIYSSADVFVIPSLEDNLPNTVVEAMACGVPVVGFDIGGIPDMIDHKKTGYLVPAKDTTALAEGIEWVLSSNDRGEDLRTQCRQKAVDQYALEMQARNYKALYNRLLQNEKGNMAFNGAENKQPLDKKSFCKSVGEINRLGQELLIKGDIKSALNCFLKALKIAPYDRQTVLNCGRVLNENGQIESAKQLYYSYLSKNPNDSEIIAEFNNLAKNSIAPTQTSIPAARSNGSQIAGLQSKRKTVLVYLGLHRGANFDSLFRKYDECYGFEANPALFAILQTKYGKYPNVHLSNVAVADRDGFVEFNISSNDGASSSIGHFDEQWENFKSGSVRMEKTITVPSINLYTYLKQRNVDYIDNYVSDLQGMDLQVLRTLKPLIEAKRIGTISCEVTKDDKRNIYSDLPDNNETGFYELLDEHYELIARAAGLLNDGDFSGVPEGWWELDCKWRAKRQIALHGQADTPLPPPAAEVLLNSISNKKVGK